MSLSNSRAQSIELNLVADNESHLPGHQHLEVFKATTPHAAYSDFEEDRKGSIEVGKLADLVVLSEDPLTVDPTTIKDVMVEQTILGGETVYRMESLLVTAHPRSRFAEKLAA